MKKIMVLTLGGSILLSACSGMAFAAPDPTMTFTPPPPTQTATVTPTFTAVPTFTTAPTFTASPVPTATWVYQGPDAVQVPILMYHRIDTSPNNSPYYMPPAKFEEQIKLLHDWEYTTITTEMLVKAITEGASLPPRPVIISFDDGNIDNYTTALPIMQKYGFTGILYIVESYVGADKYMNADQIVEMYNAGWEVGSHSMSHQDLTTIKPDRQRFEIVESREKLQSKLGIPILTFAYPFGKVGDAAVDYVKFAGYIAGMGATGFTADQGLTNLYVLQRCEIRGSEDAKTFIRFLPWHGDPIYLPTDTPLPTVTPTRTPKPTWTP